MNFKIIELQGLRCVAIISVLLYHCFPQFFANGFLGVDVFFVISGYIMALILLSTDSLKTSFISATFNFYYRRIYRILPLYLINCLAMVIFIPAVSYTAVVEFKKLKSVLTFTKNFEDFFKKNYYFATGLHHDDWFLHYWSLCVEMQFYLIVPFLLYISKRLPCKFNLFVLWPTLIAACVILIFYLLGKFGDIGALFTFNMLPARFYEFAGGFIAFHAQTFIDEQSKNCKYMLKFKELFQNWIVINILTGALLAIVLCPIKLIDIYSLPATVIVTSACIISIGKTEKNKREIQNSILANNIAVFIGNASYAIYIFHWMFIIIARIKLVENHRTYIAVLALVFIVGIIIHNLIEKPIIKAKLQPKIFFIYVFIGCVCIICAGYFNSFEKPISDYTKHIFHNKSRLIINPSQWEDFASTIEPEISAELGLYVLEKSCGNNYPRTNYSKILQSNPKYPASINESYIWSAGEIYGTGNLSVLVIGNSHAECAIPGIEMALSGHYSEINFVGNAAATPFEGFKYSKAWYIFLDVVEHHKPDIIFLIFAYLDFDESPNEPIETDKQTQSVQDMISFLSNNSKALFISRNTFTNSIFAAKNFAEQMYHYGWSTKYRAKQEDIENEHAVSARRWKVIKCKNCIFINMLEPFCKDGWCSPLDESGRVPLLRDTGHHSIFGAYKLSITIEKHIKQMYKLIDENKIN